MTSEAHCSKTDKFAKIVTTWQNTNPQNWNETRHALSACYLQPDLIFGVGCVDPLAVSAGPQKDLDGVELQQDLAGHAVEEGDVGQSCGRQQEHLATGGALTQLWQGQNTAQPLRSSP